MIIDSFSPADPKPGETVTATLSGLWSLSGKTARYHGHPIAITRQSADRIQFVYPSLHTDSDFRDVRYRQPYVFMLSDGDVEATRMLTGTEPVNHDLVTISGIHENGIFADDSGAAAGDDVLGHYTMGSGNFPLTPDGILDGVTVPAVFEYWIFDVSAGFWTAAASENIYVVVEGTDTPAPGPFYDGVAITPFQYRAVFNDVETHITDYGLVGGTLPTGLSLDPVTGDLTGTPTDGFQEQAGLIVQATDSVGNTAETPSHGMTVYAAPSWEATPGDQNGSAGSSLSLDLSSFVNAESPVASWSQLVGTLPAGVTFNTSTGLISGTPTASGTFSGLQFRATNPAGNGDSGTFNIIVSDVTIVSDVEAAVTMNFGETPGPVCRDAQRRADILIHPMLNGIDFVEYEDRPADLLHPHVLTVRFLKPLPDPPHSNPDGAYGLTTHPEWMKIEGGTRVVGIEVFDVRLINDDHLEIDVDQAGDFSTYRLFIGWQRQPDGTWIQVIPALDPQFSIVPVNFKAGCPVDFDCRELEICPPERLQEPLIDYLAKDYASFRQLLLDLIPQRNPGWLERNPADLGIALVELLAYTGDALSYFQDAVANEATLDTARQRISAKRHARLVDYRMHDGRNAWAFVHIAVNSTGTVSQGTKVLTRIGVPLRNQTAPPAVVIAEADLPDDAFESDPALAQVRVFETSFPLAVYPENNTILLHAWGNLECCLPRGTISAHAYVLDPSNPQQGIRPELKAGDFLLLEEVRGPVTGDAADADAAHRQVVRLVEVLETEDPAYQDQLQDGRLQVWVSGSTPLPLLRVSWRREDALTFPLCLSTRPPGGGPILNISVGRGNMVLADHGRTVREETPQSSLVPPDQPFRLRLGQGPLTLRCQPETVTYEVDVVADKVLLKTPRFDLSCTVRETKPAIGLLVDFPTGRELWRPVPDLMDSPPFARHFVADTDNDGRAILRFGDGVYGREAAGAIGFTATYRMGNGRAGNIGAEALAHLVRPEVAPSWPSITTVRNPLSAQDGVDPETIEEVRQIAPAAFHAEPFRAVTEADYAMAAGKLSDVSGAVATFRWTGSWHTVFVGVDPKNPADLMTDPGGRTRLAPGLAHRVRAFLTRYTLAGYDLEIRSAQYVPLEIDLDLCVDPYHFRGEVVEAVRQALSHRVNPDRTLGFFHPDHFTFGQAVYISRLYAAVEAVEGVDSVVVMRFQRFGKLENGEIERGIIPIGPWEIARMDNDPNFMENGVLRINARGGK